MEPIANILRTLRNERGYTQTEVAAALNLTSQAVSKWENGSGLPDVTQLVPLADFYGVTVDRLLGRKDHAAEQEVTDFIEKYRDILWFAQEYSKEHSVSLREAFDVGLDEGRAMMKKYPDDYRLKSHVCYMLDIAPKESDCDESYWNARNSELIDLAETIPAECTDSRYRNRAIWQLAMTYPYQNRYDKVKELAELVPDMYGCKEAILCKASEYGTEENRTAYELHLKRSMMNVHFDLSMFYHMSMHYHNRNLPPEDILALTEMEWNIFHAYHDHGDFDTWRTCDLFENRMTAACAALILGQSSDAVRLIGEGLDMLAASIANTDETFTSSFLTHTGKRVPYSKCRFDNGIRNCFEKIQKNRDAQEFCKTEEFAALRRRLDEILA